MGIFSDTDSDFLDEVRKELDSALTAEELPDSVLSRRTVYRRAERETLKNARLTVAEYEALPEDDERREICEELVIQRMARALIPSVAQILMDSEQGLMTRYQRIDWKMKQQQLDAAILRNIRTYFRGESFFEAVTGDKCPESHYEFRRGVTS